MGIKTKISIEDLLINPKNYRFEPVTSQSQAINTMLTGDFLDKN